MDIPSQLLNCEIQHLGQMLQVLSCELTFLQEFLKDKFGPDYELFRENLLSSQQQQASSPSPPPPSRRKASKEVQRGNVTARKSTTKQRKVATSSIIPERVPVVGDTGEEDQGESGSNKDVEAEGDNDGNGVPLKLDVKARTETSQSQLPQHGISKRNKGKRKRADPFEIEGATMVENSDDETSHGIKQEIGAHSSSQQIRRGGRRRARIWEEFINLEKSLWACKNCMKEFKCPQADRLERHVFKCLTGGKAPKKESNSNSKSGSLVQGSTSSGGEQLLESESDNAMINMDTYTSLDLSPTSRGRKLDPVWEYFITSEDPLTGRKTAVCKNCKVTVYGKVDSVRKHFHACHQLGKVVTTDKT